MSGSHICGYPNCKTKIMPLTWTIVILILIILVSWSKNYVLNISKVTN